MEGDESSNPMDDPELKWLCEFLVGAHRVKYLKNKLAPKHIFACRGKLIFMNIFPDLIPVFDYRNSILALIIIHRIGMDSF